MSKQKLLRLIVGTLVLAAAIIIERKITDSYITLAVFLSAYILLGGDVILRALKNIVHGNIFDENFLMSLATCGAFAIGECTEAVGVMLFYQIGEAFQEMAVEKSKKSITNLMDIRPDYANLVKGDKTEITAPDKISVGEFILVKPGEKIPLDGVVTEGQSFLDTSALTGESVPRSVNVGTQVMSGCVNQTGVLKIRVTKIFGESTVSKIINLAENAQNKKAKTENFITAFARYYTPIVVISAVLLAVLPPLITSVFFVDGGAPSSGALSSVAPSSVALSSVWLQWLRRSLVFLVISCPCALVLSIPMSFFAGIGRAAKNGILVKGGNYLEAFNNLEIAVFDKTGTLTKGVFKVTDIQPAAGYSEAEVLELAAYAETYSNHPIALSILKEYGKEIDKNSITEYNEIPGHGIEVKCKDKTIIAGNSKLMEKHNISYPENNSLGTIVHVAINSRQFVLFDDSSFSYAGCITISDEIKPDSKTTLDALKNINIKTVMLTGDNVQTAYGIAEQLGIKEVYAGLLPHEKAEKVELLNSKKSEYGKLAFIGDGINDAPVLSMADIGIAMGGLGSDAAVEAADVVFITDEISKLPEVINIARFTKKIVWQNIVFALGIKTAFLALGAFGFAGMWEAVFADVGVALLAVLNAMRIIRK